MTPATVWRIRLEHWRDTLMRTAVHIEHWPAYSLIAGGLAIGVVALFAWCHVEPTPLPPRESKTRDSLAITKPRDDSTRTATTGAITTVITKLVHDSAAVARLTADATRARHVADSLALVAQQSADSATQWHLAYDARTREAADLRIAVDTLTRDLSAAKDTLSRALRQIHADSLRIGATDQFAAQLVRDLAKADPPCRVLGVARCPSRNVVAIASLALGALAVRAIK